MTGRLLITGSRSWEDRRIIAEVLLAAYNNLSPFVGPEITLVGGGAEGADEICKSIWHDTWRQPYEEHRPNWRPGGIYNPAAGFDRNGYMVFLGANAALSFDLPCVSPRCRRPEPHISHGTEDCIRRIEEAGIPLWRWSVYASSTAR